MAGVWLREAFSMPFQSILFERTDNNIKRETLQAKVMNDS